MLRLITNLASRAFYLLVEKGWFMIIGGILSVSYLVGMMLWAIIYCILYDTHIYLSFN